MNIENNTLQKPVLIEDSNNIVQDVLLGIQIRADISEAIIRTAQELLTLHINLNTMCDSDKCYTLDDLKAKGDEFFRILQKPLYERLIENEHKLQNSLDVVKTAIEQLADELAKIQLEHKEVSDTAVRDEIHVAMRQAFIMPLSDYLLPNRFAMFSEMGDLKVKTALEKFLNSPAVIIAAKGLTPQERLEAWENSTGYHSLETRQLLHFKS